MSEHMRLFEDGVRELQDALVKIKDAIELLGLKLTSEAEDCLKLIEEIERLKEENELLKHKLTNIIEDK